MCYYLFLGWFVFHGSGLSEMWVGLLLLAISLFVLCSCLVLMVKLLHSLLAGRIAKVIRKTINADLPGRLSFLTGYVAILMGAGMTILVQSSSVFTSALTPLVGLGVIRLERMYPLTLGSNIGTTGTGLLAAMAASGDKLGAALQIALCHLFFNISGILLFYPIPASRIPIKLAKMMGNTTAQYRWFAVFYLVVVFFIVPGIVFSLSMLGLVPMSIVVGCILLILLVIIAINVMQRKYAHLLPTKLRSWDFLPIWLHSLDPLDWLVSRVVRQCCCCRSIHKRPSHSPIVTHIPDHLQYLCVSSADTSTESSPANSCYTSTSILTHKSISVI